jgi:hypothetical protein
MSPSRAQRRRLARRSDEIIASLYMTPFGIQGDGDLVILIDRLPPHVVPPELWWEACRAIGSDAFADEIVAVERRPGHVLTLTVIEGWIQAAWIPVQRLALGGAA